MMVPIADIKLPAYQRRLRAWKVTYLAQKMRERGYNTSYPVTLDEKGYLVDGGHRVEAAQRAGLTAVPCVIKPSEVAAITHGIRCNEDGTDTERHDVFDYAALCAELVGQMKDEEIATLLGWNNRQSVIYHRNIRTLLHTYAWECALSVTTIGQAVTPTENDLVTADVTKVTLDWRETHFRAFLSHLPYTAGDRAAMRAQVCAIHELLTKPDKLTAKTAGSIAEKYAWRVSLAKLMTTTLVADVGLGDRKVLLKAITQNVYGEKSTTRDRERFMDTLTALNEKALGVKLYHADALQWLPTLDDHSVDLVVTDPPYNTTEHAWDDKGSEDEYIAWMQAWLQALRPKLKDAYHLFVFCDPDYAAPLEIMLAEDGWPLKSRIVWKYDNLVKGRDVTDTFIKNYQFCFHCGTHALNFPPAWDKSRFTVQEFATPQSNFTEGRHHPTAKPVELLKHFVALGSKAGDVVVDLFAGGGTTGQACAEVKQRRCTLVEIDDAFCAVIEQRLGIKRVAL